MRNFWLSAILLTSCSLAFGQLSSNSITITASRSATLQPDQAVFTVSVTSNTSTSLDQVVTALQGSGVSAANFSGVGTQSQYTGTAYQQVQQWSFTLDVPFSQIQTTIATLSNTQQTIRKSASGLAFGFSLSGIQVSQQLRASQTCPIPALMADAQAQAQKVAGAAGFGVGRVQAMSNGNPSIIANGALIPSFVVGDFLGAGAAIGVPMLSQFLLPTSTLQCSIVVKFALVSN